MKIPTMLDFLTECLVKSGLEVEQYHLSDNSGSGIVIKRQNERGRFDITLDFDGKGMILEDVRVYAIKVEETDQDRIL